MRVLLTLIILLFTLNLNSQILVGKKGATVNYVNLPEKIQIAKRSSVSIERYDTNNKALTVIGSGFLITKNKIYYAVTNFHVVNSIMQRQSILIGLNDEKQKQYATVEQTYIDEKHDIAVLKMGNYIPFTNRSVDTTLMEAAALGISFFESSDKIVEGSGAIIIGYPLGLGREFTGNRPVSKIGIIAQEPNNKTNTFLLDCIANPGNSGSPVFSDEPLKLIGMVTSYKPDNISLYDDQGSLRASLPYNSGITICVTAEMIQKVIP